MILVAEKMMWSREAAMEDFLGMQSINSEEQVRIQGFHFSPCSRLASQICSAMLRYLPTDEWITLESKIS